VEVGKEVGRPDVGEGNAVAGRAGGGLREGNVQNSDGSGWELLFEVCGGCVEGAPAAPVLEGGKRHAE
jgi:hypothetical protein